MYEAHILGRTEYAGERHGLGDFMNVQPPHSKMRQGCASMHQLQVNTAHALLQSLILTAGYRGDSQLLHSRRIQAVTWEILSNSKEIAFPEFAFVFS